MAKYSSLEPIAYSVTDAGKMLSVSRATIYNLITAGELQAIHVPGMRRTLIARTELEAWLERQRASQVA